MKRKVLIVAAHPDDEVLGCGGTVSRLIREGYEAYTLILGEGITSRDKNRNRENRKKEINKLKKQIYKANKILGVKEVFTFDFPDNRFDSVDFIDIVKTIEEVKNNLNPEIIFTHSKSDLNIDHQITYKAVITATRPMKEESVKQIYSFEVLSSTEWNYPLSFSPNVYFDIEKTLELKLKAMSAYEMELREYPHPRSLEGIKIKAGQRGIEAGFYYAEAFELIRIIY
ncbi:PIG-L deacetylase family protein [Persephonella sp.]